MRSRTLSGFTTPGFTAVVAATILLTFAGGLCSGASTPPVAGSPDCRAQLPATPSLVTGSFSSSSTPTSTRWFTEGCPAWARVCGGLRPASYRAASRAGAARLATERFIIATVSRGEPVSCKDVWAGPHTAVLLSIPAGLTGGGPTRLLLLILMPQPRGAAV